MKKISPNQSHPHESKIKNLIRSLGEMIEINNLFVRMVNVRNIFLLYALKITI